MAQIYIGLSLIKQGSLRTGALFSQESNCTYQHIIMVDV